MSPKAKPPQLVEALDDPAAWAAFERAVRSACSSCGIRDEAAATRLLPALRANLEHLGGAGSGGCALEGGTGGFPSTGNGAGSGGPAGASAWERLPPQHHRRLVGLFSPEDRNRSGSRAAGTSPSARDSSLSPPSSPSPLPKSGNGARQRQLRPRMGGGSKRPQHQGTSYRPGV
mmetsp:Transcript_83639/g.165994  ORF Transcript_83639/g.165994 Transcript_83639/m.165994 type:complete len:174 (+) Transcript_83639:3-524(+)